jgi:hypothetical protein
MDLYYDTCIEVYAEHIISTGDDRNDIANIKKKKHLYQHFETTDLSKLAHCWGIEEARLN